MKVPLVSIVVVTYNSAPYLEKSLASLKQVQYKDLELIIIDNASTDNTLELIKKVTKEFKFPCTIIKNKHNHGYAKGNNIGIKASSGEFVFVLNPDTQLTPDFLTPLVATMEKSKTIGACQPTVYLLNNKRLLNLTGKVTQYLGFDWLKDYLSKKIPLAQQLTSFSGSGVLLRKAIFNKLHGFDEFYFMYHEDSDLSWRMRAGGFSIEYVPSSHIFHDYKYEPDPEYQSFSRKFYFYERNRLLTVLKNYSLRSLVLISPMIVFLEFALQIYAVAKGLGVAKFSTYLELWRNRDYIKKVRSRTQKKRVLTDRELTRGFVSRITFQEFSHPLLNVIVNPLMELYWRAVRTWL